MKSDKTEQIQAPAYIARSPAKTLLWRALAAGETFHKHSAAARFGWHLSSADEAICQLHADKLVHIIGWTRNGNRGPMTKIIAFGPGEDVPRPAKLPNVYICQRWRNNNPDKARRSDRESRLRRLARQGKLPKGNDPLLFAIMGGTQSKASAT
jgi:hypothetical protein